MTTPIPTNDGNPGSAWWCPHDDYVVALKVRSNGSRVYVYQCVRCGNNTPVPVQRKAWAVERAVPFDERLRGEWQARAAAVYDRQREEEQAEWRRWYEQYLTTAAWRQRRAKVLDRANRVCEVLWQLVAICDECHERRHEKRS